MRTVETADRDQLPATLRAFLYACIDSVEQLEVLMLLRMSGEPRTARTVAREVGITDAQARASLDTLTARGLVHATIRATEISYTFRPASETLASYCSELAVKLASARSDVLQFVASLPPPAIRAFATAFRLRDAE
jgi:hypothetical protein